MFTIPGLLLRGGLVTWQQSVKAGFRQVLQLICLAKL